MPGSPSNVARTKTTAVSTYNEAGKDYFLHNLGISREVAESVGLRLEYTYIVVGGKKILTPTFIFAGGKAISFGAGIGLSDLKLKEGTFLRPVARAGVSFTLPKTGTGVEVKALNIARDMQSFFGTLEVNQELVKDWLSASAEYINMGLKKNDVQFGLKLSLQEIVRHPLTIQFIKSLKNAHTNYEFYVSTPVMIGGNNAYLSIGVYGAKKEHVGTLFFTIPFGK